MVVDRSHPFRKDDKWYCLLRSARLHCLNSCSKIKQTNSDFILSQCCSYKSPPKEAGNTYSENHKNLIDLKGN